ncbi:hypothetical protein DPEC_G00219550 [Dallia pectoralis]|uniref:Uncharacterized protein n=1 Tax=Dallia pectoralis TaxID=75939 RepID=A0ACC2G3C2_DALPE|nr:hypothetical protein DPEC_G00219550 [Dallia pectoralis]
MKVVWQKQAIPTAWRRAGSILIPKEKDSVEISQFRQISLLNVEGKIFFSVVARRLTAYLEKNHFIDTMVQKTGIPGFSGCLEHVSMIWNQIQTAKKDGRDLHVVFLDLANAFGSVPHNLRWTAFNYFSVPELTVPWEAAVEEAFERKSLKYTELAVDAEQRGWKAKVCPVEVGCRGFVGKSTIRLLKELGVQGQTLRRTINALSGAAEASRWLWMKRGDSNWAPNIT